MMKLYTLSTEQNRTDKGNYALLSTELCAHERSLPVIRAGCAFLYI